MNVNVNPMLDYWCQVASGKWQSATCFFFLTTAFIFFLVGCGTEQNVAADTAVPQSGNGNPTIIVDATAEGTAVDPRIFGSNAPAWLGASRLENQTFINRTKAAGITLIRLPGGSWSNWYPWLECEQNNEAVCASWIADPTDFINFLQATGAEGMYTVNQNRTAKEAAALVAFFNGDVNDDRDIGVDVQGPDWGKVSDWAQLRADHGNPNPINIKYFEVGNEIYGATQASGGSNCASWGWEDVWTCDGTEYVNGIGSGSNRKEGFKEFQTIMQWVDPSVEVGAVGVSFLEGWSDEFGEEVIAEAGDIMEFYIIHQYAYNDPPSSMSAALAAPQSMWAPMRENVDDMIEQHSSGSCPALAVTEYNMFAFDSGDSGQWMTRNVNMLFMADTIGQLIANEFDIATQWDLANGTAGKGTDYGLMNADTYARAPQYYAFPLWA
ncbi:MAG TPA: alpha-L-arabinofuranosidase [Anaerolineae bacterium]|nr:alpha-L-arabinofuranosidase [Anaerolineae bacterium]